MTNGSEIVSFLAREVRTSLSSVLGFVESLYDSNQSTKEKFISLRKIRAIIENTAKGLEELEQLTALESETAPAKRETQFSLEEELSDTLISLQSAARRNDIVFRVKVRGKVPTIIRSEPLRLQQIVTHLAQPFLRQIESAIVQLTFSLSEKKLLLEMDSTGPNVAMDCFRAVMEEEGESSSLSIPVAYGRMAMDLSLIQILAQSLGGGLSVEPSQLGQGLALVIAIDPGPIGPETPMTEALALRPIEESTGVKAIAIPNFQNRAILIVDDDDDIRQIFSHFLNRTGAKVEVATDGESALKLAKEKKFDLIFMDLQMPNGSGLEACATLRDQKVRTPIIALTVDASPATRTKCQEAGFSLFLTKPISMESLFEIIPRVLM